MIEDIFKPNQRMLIIQGLYRDPDYRVSSDMLQRLLRQFGHSCGIAEVNDLVAELECAGYLTTERLAGMVIAKLTRSGLDVAEGSVIAPGIDRPPLEP